MKNRCLTSLILLLSLLVSSAAASTYGRPYGASDETAVERSDVKSIDEINRATEIEERRAEEPEPVVEEPVPNVENAPAPDPAAEPQPVEEETPPTQ